MNESAQAFTTALDCKHAVEKHESDDTCWQCTMKIVSLTKDAELRAEDAEARAAQLQAERDHYHALVNSWIEHSAQIDAERDALAAELATVKAERDALKLEASQPWYNPALDEGDGVYRP